MRVTRVPIHTPPSPCRILRLPRARAEFFAANSDDSVPMHLQVNARETRENCMPQVILVDHDLGNISVRTKHMSELITRAEGHQLLMDATTKAGKYKDHFFYVPVVSDGWEQLFERAVAKFRSALAAGRKVRVYGQNRCRCRLM